jgi:hypothetical protein
MSETRKVWEEPQEQCYVYARALPIFLGFKKHHSIPKQDSGITVAYGKEHKDTEFLLLDRSATTSKMGFGL